MAAFTFDGRTVPFEPGDTLGSALHRAGVKVISRSLRYHRPRGLYCNAGSCASCFVGVDGVPNVPACMALAHDGLKVESQNTLGSAKHDLFGIVDKVYRKGFEPHHAFTKPRLLNEAFLKGVRFMSGLGSVPAPDAELPAPRRHTLEVQELVVGAGHKGLARAHAAAAAGIDVLLIDEAHHLGGTAVYDPMEDDTRRLARSASKAWTGALAFGLYREHGRLVAGIRRLRDDGGEDLWEVTAARVTLATGSHDAWPLFVNNDLPGILSLRGAQRLWGEHQVLPGKAIVVHGPAMPAALQAQLEAAGARVLATGTVRAAKGGTVVEAAEVDGTWIPCDTILCNLPGTPRVELHQQAGCDLAFQGGVLAPVADAAGATSVPGVFVGVPG
ncbi:MAG: hypothetical protein QOD77_1801 [Thermoplasmata archaeon]|nr:hypothetical protein [Thermoplasmata archaeon]